MPQDRSPPWRRPVPGGRFARLARFGGMAGGVAGGMVLDGLRQLGHGQRPDRRELLLTPANAIRVTRELAHLRGAAMKLGQLVSMDTGDVVPPEVAEILAQLRAEADPMPHAQLQAALDGQWGPGWRARFAEFALDPVAAASIGQVHRARTRDGRALAVKVQYPGMRASIDSDIDNIAVLLRYSGLVPAGLDLGPLLDAARRQLHAEADYAAEAAQQARFAALLGDAPDFAVPALAPELCGSGVLAMTWAEGVTIAGLACAPKAERDRVATRLIELVLRELFEFRLMQTDPNLENYLYDRASGRIVLLDFGATRALAPGLVAGFRRVLRAARAGDAAQGLDAAVAAGLLDAAMLRDHRAALQRIFEVATAPLRAPGAFDFAASGLVRELHDAAMALAAARDIHHVPPADALLVQRKIAGTYLLAARLRARVDLGALVARYP